MASPLKECNIILLGESGTGKSLFINSFANYAQYSSLNKAIASKNPTTLISSKFVVTDSNDQDYEIKTGENDGNERTELGKSFTLKCMSYKFQLGDLIVRLIDTPGVGDTDGEGADGDNVANILSFINHFDNLHAIGIILKNSETKMTDKFTYCLQTLLTNLNKTAVNNIVFLLTFCNGFKPGPAKNVIKLFIENELTNSQLILEKKIMYCFDNASYEFLIAANRGIQFDQRDSDIQSSSWKYSSQEISRLMIYIRELNPHKVKESTSLNDARHFIKVIHPFIIEVLKNIETNTNLITKCQDDLQATDENVKNMESDDRFKLDDIEIVVIELPITFCVSPACRQMIRIGDEEKYHYPRQCCQGCRVSNLLRWWCEAMDWQGKCKVCGCPGSEHDRRFFKTEKTTSNMLTEEAVEKLRTAGSAKERLGIQIESLREKKAQLSHEKKVFEDAEKKFAKFLQTNALIKPSERKYRGGNPASVSAELHVIEKFDKEINSMESISMEEFYQLKTTLINLPINGIKLKQILDAHEKGTSSSFADKVTTILSNNVFSNYYWSDSIGNSNSRSLSSTTNNSINNISNCRSLTSKPN